MSIKKSILLRVRMAFMVIVGITILIAFRIVYIQFAQGERWEEVARENGLQYRIQKAIRGNIYGEDGIILATSIPLYKVSLDPTIVSDEIYKKDILKLCDLLAVFFNDKSPTEYLRKINEARLARRRYVIINTKPVTLIDRKKMEKWPIFKEGQHKGGVLFEKVDERSFPFKDLAARTIGFMNENKEGAGLEFTFNAQLAGVEGRALYQKITGGDWKPVSSATEIKPQEGFDIYTTIDVNIQDLSHSILKEALIKNQAAYGCVIVMEVKTGAIRAMVNLGKDKDRENEYIENYNYAVGDQGSTDPGSTFKLASMLALLEDTTISLKDSIETGGGSYKYYDRTMTDSRRGGWGKLTVQQAFEYSSNIGISKLLSQQFGRKPEKYIAYLQKFGLSTPLSGFQFSGLAKPYIKTPQDITWSGVTLPWMSVGYESKISPLQLLTLYNAIANQGYMVQPLIVKKIQKTDKVLQTFKTTINEKPICSEANLKRIHMMLEGVVERGTAKSIKSPKYKIAGKTGTSQKLNKNGRYIKKYKTSFAGYFPADNPKYSCIVVIDEPQGTDQYGGDVSAPVFRAIADKLYARDIDIQSKNLPQREVSIFKTNLPVNHIGYAADLKQICDELAIPSMQINRRQIVSPVPGRISVDWEERKINPATIPNAKGLTLRDAVFLLENKGLKVSAKGKGRVKTQSLMPGSPLRKGEKIILNLE